jgi:hypothetical protein
VVLAASRLDVDLTRETLATEEDVGVTAVLDLGETGLLVDVEGNVLEVALDLREGDPEGVLPESWKGRVGTGSAAEMGVRDEEVETHETSPRLS